MDVQLKKPAKKSIGLSKDKNCQVTICENTDSNSQVSGIWTRAVKKMKILICSQWQIQIICSYPNQQYYISTEDCVVTRTVNLPDVTRKGVQ